MALVTGYQRQDEPSVWDLATLAETSALLDRLGGRRPTPDDLDDPVAAALAVFAADVDLAAVPVATTRRAAAAAGLLPAAHVRPQVARTEVDWPWAQESAATRPMALPTDHPIDHPIGHPFRQAGSAHADPEELPVLLSPSGYGFTGPAQRSAQPPVQMRLRALPVLAATASAVLLSMGAAAAVSGGRTVNPAQVVQGIVAQVQGDHPDRTTPGLQLGGAGGAGRAGGAGAQRPSRGGAAAVVTRPGGTHTGPGAVPTLGLRVPALGQAGLGDGAATPSGPLPDAGQQPVQNDLQPVDTSAPGTDQVTADPTGAPWTWAPDPASSSSSSSAESTSSSGTGSSGWHSSTSSHSSSTSHSSSASHSPRGSTSTRPPEPSPSRSHGHD